MKFAYKTMLVLLASTQLSLAQKDLDMIYCFIDQYSCAEDLNLRLRIKNEGTETIPDFTIHVENEDGEIFEKNVTTPLTPGEDRFEEMAVQPNKLFASFYDVEIIVEDDIDNTNNIVTDRKSQHLEGHDLTLKISKDAFNSPNFKFELESGERLIYNEWYAFTRSGDYYEVDLCLPEDSCYNFSSSNFFKTNWCTTQMEINYALSSDPTHLYETGDTIYSIIQVGAFFIGPLLYTVPESYTAEEISSGPINYELLVCDKPEDIPAELSLINNSTADEIFSFIYDGSTNVFNADFCLNRLDVNTPENPTKNKSLIYPNPSNGVFNISSENVIKQVSVTDQFGKVILQKQSLPDNIINLKNQPKGIYYLNYTSNKEPFTKKLITN